MEPATGSTAAIVTCHNYGRYLRACLDSLVNQTRAFDFIVCVDDSSTDDTADIARSYGERVRYVRGEWRDFTSARRAGAAAVPRTRFLVFVDADNHISPNFHEALRVAMVDPQVGVAYPTMTYIDANGAPIDREPLAREFDFHALRYGNLADACALVRTEAYQQAGGWDWVAGPSDWLLWLRVTRAGWKMRLVPEAVHHYRRHPSSMSQTHKRLLTVLQTNLEIMRRGEMVALVMLFSGRTANLEWQGRFLREVNWPNLHVVAIDNSGSGEFAKALRAVLMDSGRNFTVVSDNSRAVSAMTPAAFADSTVERTRNNYALSEHLARLYARAREAMPSGTDIVWCLEDDIEPPLDAMNHLAVGLFKNPRAGAVCGVVLSRYAGNLLAWRGDWRVTTDPMRPLGMEHLTAAPPPGRFERISGSGFMCTAFRRDVWDAIAFRPSPMWGTGCPYYDWAAALAVRDMGREWLISGSVRCRHWQKDGPPIDPPA